MEGSERDETAGVSARSPLPPRARVPVALQGSVPVRLVPRDLLGQSQSQTVRQCRGAALGYLAASARLWRGCWGTASCHRCALQLPRAWGPLGEANGGGKILVLPPT